MNNSGIYKILNKINGKFYIGSAKTLRHRERDHFIFLRNGNHPNIHLQRASEKYGIEAFDFIILEYVKDLEKLTEREQHYLDILNPEYNILKVAGSLLGFKHSKETKQKYKNRIWNEETNLKRSLATKGIPKSDEHKAKIGIGNSKPTIWPCAEGNKCKCDRCRKLRNFMNKSSPSYLWKKPCQTLNSFLADLDK